MYSLLVVGALLFLLVGDALIVDTGHVNFGGRDLILQEVDVVLSFCELFLSVFQVL